MTRKITFHTDGACSGNPGPGGWAVTCDLHGQTRFRTGGSSHTTNNIMEMKAAIEAFKWAHDLADGRQSRDFIIRLDSEYVRKGLEEWLPGWKARNWLNSAGKPVKNQALWMEIEDLRDRLAVKASMDLIHVKGHAGDPGNELADQKAVEARERSRREVGDWIDMGDEVREKPTQTKGISDIDSLLEEARTRGYMRFKDHFKSDAQSYLTSVQLKRRDGEDILYFVNVDFYDMSGLSAYQGDPIVGEVHVQFHEKDNMEGAHVNLGTGFTSFEDAEAFASRAWNRLNCGAYAAENPGEVSASRHAERLDEALALLAEVGPGDIYMDDFLDHIRSTLEKRQADKEVEPKP